VRLTVTLAIVLALCAPLSAFGSPSTASPKAELSAMRSAARDQNSVHYVSVSTSPGRKIRIVADVGISKGIQRITVTDHGRTGPATAMVRGRVAFIRGNAFTMAAYFGFKKAQVKKYAGKWISVPSTYVGFASVSADVTFPSFLTRLFPLRTKLSLVTAGGLIGVHGTVHTQGQVAGTATIFAPAHGKPLPVKQTAASSGHTNGVVTMSHWNEAVNIMTPENAVPITKVVGKA